MMLPAGAGVGVLAVLIGSMGTPGQPPQSYRGNCTDAGCHGDYVQRAVVHAPADDGSCDVCHEPKEGPGHHFQLTYKEPDLCTECHDSFEGKVLHDPVSQGQCIVCHDPHGSEAEKLLTEPNVASLCAECHDSFSEEGRFLHGPVAAGACTACHDPHASEQSGLLLPGDGPICLKCHTALAARLRDKAHQHAPAVEECTACHDPHVADNAMILHATAPELCLDCHDSIADVIDDATVTHDAVTTGKSCLACHDPHASDVEQILRKEPMDLCLGCHDRELTSAEGKLGNIKQLLEDHRQHHGPILDRDCTACHKPHGGGNFRMLTEAYPSEFYASFDEEQYALCFGCHEAEAVLEPQTDELTDFRNGEQNLHYVHVNRAAKGRTCRACHEVHASSQPKHIRESVPFGQWRVPINFVKTETGGSCAPGCHRPYRYDRGTPAVNVPR